MKDKVTEAKAQAMVKMRKLGITVKVIAKIYGLSTQTVTDYTVPDHYKRRLERTVNYYRRTQIITGTTKDDISVIKHLNKRPHTDVCELCGAVRKKKHYYHHWDKNSPSLGMWICFKCHRLAEFIDNNPDFQEVIAKYLLLKSKLSSRNNSIAVNSK